MKHIPDESLPNTLPSANPTADTGIVQQILRFNTHGTQYAVDLEYVECVTPILELQYVPGSPYYLAGLMNYRGTSLAVVDLGLWLGLEATENFNLDTPIIICSNGKHRTAFVVTSVDTVEKVGPEAIQMQNTFVANQSPFKASLNLDSGMVLLLDVEYILHINFTTGAPIA